MKERRETEGGTEITRELKAEAVNTQNLLKNVSKYFSGRSEPTIMATM